MAKRTAIQLGIVGLLVLGAMSMLRLEAQRAVPQPDQEPAAEEDTETSYAGLTQAERRELRRRIAFACDRAHRREIGREGDR